MYRYKAVVDRVVDGDTLVLLVDVGFSITVKEKFRLSNINAPELKTDKGKQVKQLLIQKILGKNIEIKSEGKDKYGRWLAIIYLDGENVNQWLLDNAYATKYE